MVELVGSYKHKGQVVSGTLAYALRAGKAIISTPYLHAIELLDEERGVLVPFDDPQPIAAKTIELLDNGTAHHAMRKRAYLYTRDMVCTGWLNNIWGALNAFTTSACGIRVPHFRPRTRKSPSTGFQP